MFTQYPHLNGFIYYLCFQKRYSKHTTIAYQNDIETFLAYTFEEFETADIKEIKAVYIRTWLATLKEQPLTSKSINRKISSLKSFFKYLMKEGVIEVSPLSSINSPKTNKRLPVYVAENDMQTLFNYIEFSSDYNGQTERLVLQLLYNTGMRISELINLMQNQVDTANSQIKVSGKGNKERIIPVSNHLITALRAYISSKKVLTNAHVFTLENGKPLYAKKVYLMVKKNLSLVTTVQKKSPHILRHSFATHLTNNGADINAIKELLGHSSLAATQVYTHNSIEKLKSVFKKAHPKA